jgi:RNA polymerase sigma-70 factor (ECF subfamily)
LVIEVVRRWHEWIVFKPDRQSQAALTEGAIESVPAVAQEPRNAPLPDCTQFDLRALFTTHYASIWRLLRRLGVEHAQLDDAALEVFWIAARRLPDIRAGSEHAFLYGVALRVASHAQRKRRSAAPTLDLGSLDELADGAPSPEESLAQRRARAMLDSVLDRMPLELRSVFVLFELEGLPIKHIAELEDIPVGTVSSRLRRAREEFSAAAQRLRAVWIARGERF